MPLTKLAISNFLTHRVRVALTIAAIALSVSLVVAVARGFALVDRAVYYNPNKYLGSTDAQILREGHTPMDEALADEIGRDPDVAKVTARLENESGLLNRNGDPVPGRAAGLFGIRRPNDRRPDLLVKLA